MKLYGFFRSLIGLAACVLSLFILRKLKVRNKIACYLGSFIFGIFVSSIFALFVVENTFISFDSPDAAFLYYNPDVSSVELVVSGEYADMVIGKKDGTYVHSFLPKSDGQWKLGTGLNSKTRSFRMIDHLAIYLFQYEDTTDYFISIVDIEGDIFEISDSRNSEFYKTEQYNAVLDNNTTTYYTHISAVDTQYFLRINESAITFEEID